MKTFEPAPARAEFKLGIFPPDHHVPPANANAACEIILAGKAMKRKTLTIPG